MLLTRVVPGTSMREESLPWHTVLASLGEVAGRLHAVSPAGPVHGDLHPGNVLRGPMGWVAIDPHGQTGVPAEDVFALWCPEAPALPRGREREEALARVAIYADAAGVAWTHLVTRLPVD